LRRVKLITSALSFNCFETGETKTKVTTKDRIKNKNPSFWSKLFGFVDETKYSVSNYSDNIYYFTKY
jgi:hypothetical protein